MTRNKKIVFFGTPEFAVASLKALVERGHEIAAVVTMPDKQAGRGHRLLQSDVKKYAVGAGLPVLQPRNLKDPEFIEALRALDASLFIVIAFRMLPREVWAMPPLGTFNLHASLLPKYRGAAPINRAVMNGETETGVTTFFLKHEIDTGNMIEQRTTEILPEENVGDVHDKLMALGAEMVSSTVDKIFTGTVQPIPQPEGEFIPAPKIFADDCIIRWNAPAQTIHNLVRGLSPYPGARATFRMSDGSTLHAKILRTRITGKTTSAAPGHIEATAKRLEAACADSSIEILELQPAGKRAMPVAAFLAGNSPVELIEVSK